MLRSTTRAFIATTLLVGTALSGCGKQTFDVVEQQSQFDSPGVYSIPPKIDLVLAIDNTGSAGNNSSIATNLQQQKNYIVNLVKSQNWDYRIASIPLSPSTTSDLYFNQVMLSKYDPSWSPGQSHDGYTGQVEPYPGYTVPAGYPLVPSGLRADGNSFYGWQPSNGVGSNEPALISIRDALTLGHNGSGYVNFFRPDAVTVVFVLSTGEDTSDGPVDGQNHPNVSSSLINAIRNSHSYVRLFAAVNKSNYYPNNQCMGDANSYASYRYEQAASQIGGGKAYHVCSSGIANAFSNLAADLQPQQMNFTTARLFLKEEPVQNSVRVYVTRNGSETELTSGWTLQYTATALPAVIAPIQTNYKTGWYVQLTAGQYLNGTDTARITYTPAGIGP